MERVNLTKYNSLFLLQFTFFFFEIDILTVLLEISSSFGTNRATKKVLKS